MHMFGHDFYISLHLVRMFPHWCGDFRLVRSGIGLGCPAATFVEPAAVLARAATLLVELLAAAAALLEAFFASSAT